MPGNGPKQKPGKFTYADYLTWPDDEVTTVVQPDVSVYCAGDKLARYEGGEPIESAVLDGEVIAPNARN